MYCTIVNTENKNKKKLERKTGKEKPKYGAIYIHFNGTCLKIDEDGRFWLHSCKC